MVLEAYRAKRDFEKTPEPNGKAAAPKRARPKAKAGAGDGFVVQKHAASRLHYDFRLELDGVLKSWAVAKGPSLVPGEKRLAVHTEDHPLEYGGFEGTIPKGQYGGGTVMLWDHGRWIPEGDPHFGYAKGHLAFRLEGAKLGGSWHLVRMKRRAKEKQEPWLLIKVEDEAARGADAPDILEEKPLSVTTGRSLEEIAAAQDRVWQSNKGDAMASGPAKPSSPKTAVAAKTKRKTPGAPMPDFVEPCLATAAETAPEGGSWLHEIKYDGYRIQARLQDGRVALRTRNGLDWTHRFKGVAQALKSIDVDAALIDGEVMVENESGVSDFSALRGALEEGGGSARMVYTAFDLLHLDGKDLRPEPLVERKRQLAGLLAQVDPRVRYSEHIETDGGAMVRHACRLGLEGIISKRGDAPYRSGRRGDWLKIKCTQRQEFVVAGYVPSAASRRAVGSLVLGYYEGEALVHAGRVGTGFTEALSRQLWAQLDKMKVPKAPFPKRLPAEASRGAVWVRPELVAEVEYRGWTADQLLRHASFRGLREDKEARDVVRETALPKPGTPRVAKAPPATGGATVAGVTLTHPERVLWEGQGLTKQGLAEFYAEIADWVLPHLVGRPLSLVRCPSGAEKQCFYQKHAWAGVHPSVRRVMLPSDDGEDETLVIDDLTGLVALVQAGVLEIHPWGSTLRRVEQPDRVIFDLDPGEDVGFDRVIEAALEVRERLRALKLESFVKTTGGKGLHVVAPLTTKAGWEDVKGFSQQVALAMEADSPARFIATMSKKARRGRIFVDYLRNGRGQTAVAAYSTRARAGATLSTPLAWEELSPAIAPNHYTVANITRRLDSLRVDPWGEFGKLRQGVKARR